MDSTTFHLQLDYLGTSGDVLNPELKSSLQASLLILRNNNKFARVVLWGRILGMRSDYIIAQGYASGDLLNAKSFYSLDGTNWALVPLLKPEERVDAKKVSGRFEGDPSYEYEITEMKSSGEGDDATTEETTSNIKEEKRLALVIENIDTVVKIVPRGALVRTPQLQVKENRVWDGLAVAESAKLESYFHLRADEASRDLLERCMPERADQDLSIDFLEPICNDVPRGCWSLQFEKGSGLVILRSNLWPGFAFYHVPGTRMYGSFYLGNGEHNIDLPFML